MNNNTVRRPLRIS